MVQTIRTSRPLSEHTVYTRSHIESTSRTDRLQRPIGRAHGRYKTTLRWCNLSNPVYVAYHDAEWAVPSHDDHHLFEMLVLETFQAGLSWETILNKRKRFRQAFDGFDIERIRRYDENKIAELMNDPGIIRNRRKIVATVGNANAFRDIQTSYGSFDDYIWRFTGRHVIYETGMTTSPLSDAIAVDLKTYGMRFIGTTIVYAYLQSIGVINAHEPGCFLHRER